MSHGYFSDNDLDGYTFNVTSMTNDDTYVGIYVFDQANNRFTFTNNDHTLTLNFTYSESNDNEHTYVNGSLELVIDISGDGSVDGFDIFGDTAEWQLLDGTYEDNEGNILETFNYSSGIPCLTQTCNVLTPKGYQNVSSLQVGDIVTTSDNKNVAIQEIFTSKVLTSEVTPRVIRAHQYGKNQPIIDTHLSDYHAYQVNGVWKLPKNENLSQEWNNKVVTYYHIKLPNYTQDFLVVNGLTMEGWDGLTPEEIRPYMWVKHGKGVVLKHL